MRTQSDIVFTVILFDNTAHKTICNGNDKISLVTQVKSDIEIPAIYELFNNQQLGNFFDCETKSVIESMEYVVNNFKRIDENSGYVQWWVKQYLWSGLRPKYLQLLKPTNIILSARNQINYDSIETNSQNLYKKLNMLKEFYASKNKN